ncbi:MAG: polyprenol monophosphomannose synthase [SAR202 cluster bacterium]|nr:hypothetical protein [Chloroflexota bacterium]MQG39584.1 polyprenol monophosphomannose synthase [SAR202 cluster bacterium]
MTNKTTSKISVIIPTYNEAGNLPVLIKNIFDQSIQNLHLLIIDDSSPDGTAIIANQLAKEYPGKIELIQREAKLGLGSAYKIGYQKAIASDVDIVVQMDADLSHSPQYIPEFLKQLDNADIVIGSRYIEGGKVDRDWNLLRKMISKLGVISIRIVTGLKIKDVTSGFKAYKIEVLKALNLEGLKCDGFGFQAEMIHSCAQSGYLIKEHPIYFRDRTKGKSKMSIQIILEAIKYLTLIRFK